MLLALNNNLWLHFNETPQGGIRVAGSSNPLFQYLNIGSGGAKTTGGASVIEIQTRKGYKCKKSPFYVLPHYLEASSNIKKRDFTGRRKSRALVASITLCNENLLVYFKE